MVARQYISDRATFESTARMWTGEVRENTDVLSNMRMPLWGGMCMPALGA